jgi:hypothetical protein
MKENVVPKPKPEPIDQDLDPDLKFFIENVLSSVFPDTKLKTKKQK